MKSTLVMSTPASFNSWWGRHNVELGKNEFWQIGPFHLWIQHLPHQWRMNWTQTSSWLDTTVRSNRGLQDAIPPSAESRTCMFNEGRDELTFAPALADRAVIAQLASPIRVLPGETVNLYTITPLWLKVDATLPAKTLIDVPLFRMSDTWFGPMSVTGELCYASPSPTYLELREVPLRLHCVITAIQVKNSSASSLPIEKINIPMQRLSLFYSTRTGFWTDTISLETTGEEAEMASIRIHQEPPPDASPSQFVVGPRHTGVQQGAAMVRAFSALFRDRG